MKNIVLIGMPSSGKSTVGIALAEASKMTFTDTDSIIRDATGKPLSDIVNEDGLKRFLAIQENLILTLHLQNHIIATGGSVVYGEKAMQHLKENGTVIYLKTGYDEIENRITSARRFARNDGQTLRDLYNERTPLYERYADKTIECTGKSVEKIIEEIQILMKNQIS